MSYVIRASRPLGGPSVDMVIRDGLIAAMGSSVDVPVGARVIDAQNCIALPGLVDLHMLHNKQTRYKKWYAWYF